MGTPISPDLMGDPDALLKFMQSKWPTNIPTQAPGGRAGFNDLATMGMDGAGTGAPVASPSPLASPSGLSGGGSTGQPQYYQAPAYTPTPTGMDQSASGGLGGGMSTTSTGQQYGTSQVGGQIVSQTSNANNQYTALLQQLMQQAQAGQNAREKQYADLNANILGPKGYLSQLGTTGENRIKQDTANQRGAAEQDLTSRGLGNTTIRSSVLSGINRNAEQERQSLGESVAGQKANTSMSLFNMNPSPGLDTYLQLLQKLGGAAGPSGGAGSTSTMSR